MWRVMGRMRIVTCIMVRVSVINVGSVLGHRITLSVAGVSDTVRVSGLRGCLWKLQ